MAEIYFYTHPITYEDCGVLGGRTLFESGTEIKILNAADMHAFLGHLVIDAQEHCQKSQIYPFQRVGICLLLQEGGMIFGFAGKKDLGHKTYSYIDVPQEEEVFDPSIVSTFLFNMDIQVYDILSQVSEDTFRVVGYKTQKDTKKYDRAYDVFRCLDIRGTCKIKRTEKNKSFHNYIRYEAGEDFYIEAYNNKTTASREFWLGRNYTDTKYLLTSFDIGDDDYRGLFDDDGNLLIDEDIAGKICLLTDKHEYIIIDNDYNLNIIGLKMDGDE